MVKQFTTTGRPVTLATIVNVPNGQFMFAQNGDPDQKIFCHRNQGGYPVVTDKGFVVLTELGSVENLKVGTEIVLVRESSDPTDSGYTRAWGWAMKDDWTKVVWATNANKTFKAVASGHRHNGQFQSNTQNEVVLVEDRLLNIKQIYPRRNGQDPLSSGYKTRAGGVTFSQGNVTWYRKEQDGTWTEVADPRPVL